VIRFGPPEGTNIPIKGIAREAESEIIFPDVSAKPINYLGGGGVPVARPIGALTSGDLKQSFLGAATCGFFRFYKNELIFVI
jgi:hypothetical protein